MDRLQSKYSIERSPNSPNEESLLSSQEGKHEEAAIRPRTKTPGDWLQDWWLREIISLFAGIVAIVAIAIVLRVYQDQPSSQVGSFRNFSITLNTVVSILSTVSRICLLYSVAQCISQQKWVWFAGSPRPLKEIETFDSSSRGGFGSLVMLWRLNVRQIASLGALILLFGLAVDPLSQELLHYELQPQPDPSSSANISTALTWSTTSDGNDLYTWPFNSEDLLSQVQEPPLFMKAAVQNGLLTLGSTLNDTQPSCASGNCTFPLYWSLAVCTRWENVTDHLKFSTYQDISSNTTTGRWFLTNNSYIETVGTGDFGVLNMSSAAKSQPIINNADVPNALDFGDTIAFADNPYPIADFFVLYINRSDPSTTYNYNAVEFILEWCVQEYNISVVNGTVYNTKEDSTHNFTGGHSELTGPNFNTTSQFGDELSYNIDNQTHFILSNYLRKVLNGSVYQIQSDFYKTSDAAESLFQRINTDGENFVLPGEDKGLPAMIEVLQNIATSMTNTVRNTEYTFSSMGNQQLMNKYMLANGTTWRQQAFVRVQWAWFTAPATLVILSLLFCSATIVQSSIQRDKYMVWKSSSLSTMLALSEKMHGDIGGLKRTSENESLIADTRAQLGENDEGEWRLKWVAN